MKNQCFIRVVCGRHLQRSGRILSTVTALALLVTVVGCPPQQYGNDQVPDVNINFTGQKDDQFVGMPTAVDAIVAAYLAAPGAPPPDAPSASCRTTRLPISRATV